MQRQKVALVRALLRRTRILILNNALAPLDGGAQARMVAALRREMRGRAVVLVSDNDGLAAGFDETLVMRDGQVAERKRMERPAPSS